MTILREETVNTVEALAAVLLTMPPGLPVTVYAEEGGFPARIECGVRVLHATSDHYPGGFICIEYND